METYPSIPLNRPPAPAIGTLPYGYPANANFKHSPLQTHPVDFTALATLSQEVPARPPAVEQSQDLALQLAENLSQDPNFWLPTPEEMKIATMRIPDQVAYRFFPDALPPEVRSQYPQMDRDGLPVPLAGVSSGSNRDTESRTFDDAPRIATPGEAFALGRQRIQERHAEVIQTAMDRLAHALPKVADALVDSALGFKVIKELPSGKEEVYDRPPDVRAGIYIFDRIVGRPTEYQHVTEEVNVNAGVCIYIPDNNRRAAAPATDPNLPGSQHPVLDAQVLFADAINNRLSPAENPIVESLHCPEHEPAMA